MLGVSYLVEAWVFSCLFLRMFQTIYHYVSHHEKSARACGDPMHPEIGSDMNPFIIFRTITRTLYDWHLGISSLSLRQEGCLFPWHWCRFHVDILRALLRQAKSMSVLIYWLMRLMRKYPTCRHRTFILDGLILRRSFSSHFFVSLLSCLFLMLMSYRWHNLRG